MKEIDKDGVVTYDSTDDLDESSVVRHKDNSEIFTDEYMEAFAAEADAKNYRIERTDRLVSAGVILSIIAFTIVLCWLSF